MEKELRYNSSPIKRSTDSRHVEGVAIVFGQSSIDLGFYETIDRNAVTEELLKESDVFCYLDHDPQRGVLARSNKGVGTLELWIENDGLHYAFDAPETQLGNEVLSYLQRGEINSSSFAFTVDDGGDHWEKREDGKLYRTITKIKRLYDVSPVFTPAYQQTTVYKRKFDEIDAEIENTLLEEEIEIL